MLKTNPLLRAIPPGPRARTSAEPVAAENVVIGFLDGNVRNGRLARFDPMTSDLSIDLERHGPSFIAAEKVAYIGFARAPGEERTRLAGATTEKLKVHVAGGGTFAVEAVTSTTRSNLGFLAYPTDPATPFRHLYFYASTRSASPTRCSRSSRSDSPAPCASNRAELPDESEDLMATSCARLV